MSPHGVAAARVGEHREGLSPTDGRSGLELLRHADQATYRTTRARADGADDLWAVRID